MNDAYGGRVNDAIMMAWLLRPRPYLAAAKAILGVFPSDSSVDLLSHI